MSTQTYRSVIVQRRDGPVAILERPEATRAPRIATMDLREEEAELVTLFQRNEERLRDLAAMDSWMRGEERI